MSSSKLKGCFRAGNREERVRQLDRKSERENEKLKVARSRKQTHRRGHARAGGHRATQEQPQGRDGPESRAAGTAREEQRAVRKVQEINEQATQSHDPANCYNTTIHEPFPKLLHTGKLYQFFVALGVRRAVGSGSGKAGYTAGGNGLEEKGGGSKGTGDLSWREGGSVKG
jgi:hypothetical protein